MSMDAIPLTGRYLRASGRLRERLSPRPALSIVKEKDLLPVAAHNVTWRKSVACNAGVDLAVDRKVVWESISPASNR